MVTRETFYNATTELEGTRYNVTLSYAIGDLATLSVVTSDLVGVGVSTSVTEVRVVFNAGFVLHDCATRQRMGQLYGAPEFFVVVARFLRQRAHAFVYS